MHSSEGRAIGFEQDSVVPGAESHGCYGHTAIAEKKASFRSASQLHAATRRRQRCQELPGTLQEQMQGLLPVCYLQSTRHRHILDAEPPAKGTRGSMGLDRCACRSRKLHRLVITRCLA